MQYICNFLSKRNVPLILNHLPEPNNPLVTVENWPKWDENIYVVFNDGEVQGIFDDNVLNKRYCEIKNKYEKDNIPSFENNVWNPDFITDVTEEMGYEIDVVSFDLIYGRWMKKMSGMYV